MVLLESKDAPEEYLPEAPRIPLSRRLATSQGHKQCPYLPAQSQPYTIEGHKLAGRQGEIFDSNITAQLLKQLDAYCRAVHCYRVLSRTNIWIRRANLFSGEHSLVKVKADCSRLSIDLQDTRDAQDTCMCRPTIVFHVMSKILGIVENRNIMLLSSTGSLING